MRCPFVLLAFVATTIQAVSAQQPRLISLGEALDLHAVNNLELRLARALATARIGEARRAVALPNPTASVTHEALSDGIRGAGETYMMVSQELVWPWTIGAERAAVGQVRGAAEAQFAADSARLVFELQRAYVTAWFLERRHEAKRSDDSTALTIKLEDRAVRRDYSLDSRSGCK